MSNPVCEICTKDIQANERFAAINDGGTWRVRHDGCIEGNNEFTTLPRFVMSPARSWVLTRKRG